MIDRRADERQAERHVDAAAEARGLQHRQALVVVHRDDGIVAARDVRNEHRVGGQRAATSRPARAHACDRRRDDVDLLAAEVAAFAGVRIETAHRDARRGDAESARQLARDDGERLGDAARVDRGRRRPSAPGAWSPARRAAARPPRRRPASSPRAACRCARRSTRCGPMNAIPASMHHALLHGRRDQRVERAGGACVAARREHARATLRAFAGSGVPGSTGTASGVMPHFDRAGGRGRARRRSRRSAARCRCARRAPQAARDRRRTTSRAANGLAA